MQTRWTWRLCWTYAGISKNQATSLRNFVPVFAGLLRKFAAARRSSQALSTCTTIDSLITRSVSIRVQWWGRVGGGAQPPNRG